jgi:mRNA interferase RelE/StbE
MFDVEQSNQARRFLKGTHRILSGRIAEKVESLRIDPFPPDAKRVVGAPEKQFRVRVGNYRIKYEVDFEKQKISILKIGHRSNAYD